MLKIDHLISIGDDGILACQKSHLTSVGKVNTLAITGNKLIIEMLSTVYFWYIDGD